ncbi:uncharacterized protein A4U43_C01F32900 [Asparagus officinalis]|uniref:Conserved Oligomeric Golgi complex subunit 6 C-terminal domain-containing protein n=1 Tax=Asparagus officinalis TaxID=4686 RepID=A0A5P1FXC8_ASPOF|nr:uncharacterized protein A4U43_C01F32900 [Asparagus officinalis]
MSPQVMSECLRTFFGLVTGNEGSLPEFEQLQVPKLRDEASARVSRALSGAYELLYGVITDSQNHYPDPKSLFLHHKFSPIKAQHQDIYSDQSIEISRLILTLRRQQSVRKSMALEADSARRRTEASAVRQRHFRVRRPKGREREGSPSFSDLGTKREQGEENESGGFAAIDEKFFGDLGGC